MAAVCGAGFLEQALESMAVNYEKEAKLRSAIKSAMAYPVMVLVMSFAAVILMLVFIVPVFKDMFAGFKGLRRTPHTHHPVDDAMGNAEALLAMKETLGLKIRLQ